MRSLTFVEYLDDDAGAEMDTLPAAQCVPPRSTHTVLFGISYCFMLVLGPFPWIDAIDA